MGAFVAECWGHPGFEFDRHKKNLAWPGAAY